MKRNIIIFFIVYICSGCSYYSLYFDRNYYRIATEEEGVDGIRPILPRFRLANPEPYQLKSEDLIDTNIIYTRKDMFNNLDFLRFFANGRVSSGYLEGDSLQYNKLKMSTIGYYRMRTPTELEMQEFIPYNYTHASYEYSRGIIRGDTIFMFSDPPKNKKLPEPFIKPKLPKEHSNCIFYIKRKVDTLTGTPDW